MKTYKTDITVFPENSTQIFKETCATIEEQFRDFVKRKLLIDVDGSCVQVFKKGSQEIVIYNDYDVGAVFMGQSRVLCKLQNGNIINVVLRGQACPP